MLNFWEKVVDTDRNQMFREFISDTIAQLAETYAADFRILRDNESTLNSYLAAESTVSEASDFVSLQIGDQLPQPFYESFMQIVKESAVKEHDKAFALEVEEIIEQLSKTLFQDLDLPGSATPTPRHGSGQLELQEGRVHHLRWYGDNGLVSQLNNYLKAVRRQKVSVINDEITKVASLPQSWQRELLLAYIYEANNYDDVIVLEKYESAYKICDQ